MSGHSKWASIKHKKAVVDARRGQHFTKLARAITVAAREGGGDPTGNSGLALAIQKARDASMPKDNIERAIAKGTGEGADAEQIETVLYEGYGPGGVALLIEALTDNRNRTGAEMRHILGKYGGNLGEPGSVSYLFDKRGVIVVDANRYGEDDLMPAIDAGAEDIALDEDVYEVITEPTDLAAARDALTAAGVELESADLTQRPRARVPIDESDAGKLMKLIDALEENDDVSGVHANFDVDSAVLERVAQ
ncbi:MAG TPA: YebC/PmpR family DNA-binding transcriptional regulator [Solirubrobacteraceae bacterium]|jgi:YebC/PmpR family DNA-binding regulatory protein|nr:YebC/PmpR family DNA-binding transcriptional regulator [Solirubrobacteraceae bacterium]